MILLLQLSILAIALFVTYASVIGLGSLFATIALPVMAAGVSLEIGKYVAVSYAYQQWAKLKMLEKTLLAFFITLIMVFTSAGVFSYLGQSYQENYSQLDTKKSELASLTLQAETIRKRIAVIEGQISNLPNNVVSARIRLMREYETERKPLIDQLSRLDTKIAELKQTVSVTEVHSGPITYIARATGTTIEQSATWIIIALTVCLDPFALFLTVLMNKLLILRRQTFVQDTQPVEQSKPVATPKPMVESETVVEPSSRVFSQLVTALKTPVKTKKETSIQKPLVKKPKKIVNKPKPKRVRSSRSKPKVEPVSQSVEQAPTTTPTAVESTITPETQKTLVRPSKPQVNEVSNNTLF